MAIEDESELGQQDVKKYLKGHLAKKPKTTIDPISFYFNEHQERIKKLAKGT